MSDTPTSGYGQIDPTDIASEFNSRDAHIRQVLGRVRTMMPVKVLAVYDAGMAAVTPENTGAIGAPGYVDVQPLVNQIDGAGNATPHAPIYGLPFLRFQGGGNAIICDPQAGDEGLAGFCDRDISSVKATKAQANPGSFRRFSFSDGVYFGALLTGVPTQYTRFRSNGVDILDVNKNSISTSPTGIDIVDTSGNKIVTSPTGITVTTELFSLTGSTGIEFSDGYGNSIAGSSGGITINGILFPTSGVSFDVKTHTHNQPNDGHGDVEAPTNAPNSGS